MSTELQEVTMAVAAMNKVETGLAEMRKEYGGMLYPVKTPAGMESAKLARRLIREPRFEVERIRKDAKGPILALGRKLDSEAARITRELMLIETPIHEQITAEEKRVADEKQARIEAEIQRVQSIQARISSIRESPTKVAAGNQAVILEQIAEIERLIIDSSFAEFEHEATRAKAATIASLRGLHAAAVARELEDERIAKERAELAVLRKAQEDRDRADQARRDEETRIAAECLRIDAARIAGEQAAERAAFEKEQREARERQEAEDRRIGEERAELARQTEQLRVANLPPAQTRRRDPSSEQIIDAVAEAFAVDARTALRYITSIDWEVVSA